MKDNINEEIRKTLAVTGDLKKAEMPDFFYTRLKARMENELVKRPRLAWVMKPAFVIPTLTLAVLLNVFTVRQLVKNTDNSQQVSSEESFLSEYNLDSDYGIGIY
jgi:hypothetical protein